MKSQLILGALVATGVLCLPDVSSGHGGRYLGPRNTALPSCGCGSNHGPSRPGPSGPSVPGSQASAPSASAPGPSAEHNPDDLSIWDLWWGFNQQAYLHESARRRVEPADVGADFCYWHGLDDERIESQRPTKALIVGTVRPALLKVLKTETQNDIVTGSLIALAKIGDVPTKDGSPSTRAVMAGFLKSKEQQVAETAALALGILGDEGAVPTLTSLLRGDGEGQRLVGGAVPYRTRAFAAYGLGLIGSESTKNKLRQGIVEQLLDVLVSERGIQPDIRAGAIGALGISPLDWDSEASASGTPNAAIAANRAMLLRYLVDRMSPDHEGERRRESDVRVRAQVPIAAARLLASHGEVPVELLELRGEVVECLLGLVDADSGAKQHQMQRSACIALGVIGNASGAGIEGEQNMRILQALTRIVAGAEDRQAGLFALMALGQIGSRSGRGGNRALQPKAERAMFIALAQGEGQEQPWAALALGVYGNALQRAGASVPAPVVLAIRNEAKEQRHPAYIGGYAIALGLCRDYGSEEALLTYFGRKEFSTDDARGSIAVALGLIQGASSLEPIEHTVDKSKMRPALTQQTSIALGLLGDRSASPRLIERLHLSRSSATAQSSVATALGLIGDATLIEPLIAVLLEKRELRMSDVARGYAAVALGLICDKADEPWSLEYSSNLNYTVDVRTLKNTNGDGILDIL